MNSGFVQLLNTGSKIIFTDKRVTFFELQEYMSSSVNIYEFMTDQEIVDQLKKGNSKDHNLALSAIYHSNYKMIEDLIIKNNGTRDDAFDVFQDSIVVLYQKIKSDVFVLESKLSTFLYSISRNLWLKKLRKHKKEVTLEDVGYDFLPDDFDIEQHLEYTERQKMIGRWLLEVGKACSEILKLYYFEKFRMNEIARMVNLKSEQAAKNRKSKCMKKLKAIVRSKGDLDLGI